MEELLREVLKEVRNLSFLFFAYSAIWFLLFAYLVTLARRAGRLENEINELKREQEEKKKA